MKKITWITLGILLLSSMLIAKPRMQKNDDCDGSHARVEAKADHKMGMMMCDELKLTPEQQKKFETMHTAFKKMQNTLQSEMENLQIDMRTAMKAENFKAAKEINKQIAAKKTQLSDAHIDHMESMMKELSAEQKEKAKDMFPRMMMGQGRNRGMHDGNGRMGKGMKHCN